MRLRETLILALALASANAASATTWHDGDMETFSQTDWGNTPAPGNAAALLAANYGAVYAGTAGLLEIGLPGAAGFSMLFTNVDDLGNYLPASGAPDVLDADLLDPASSASGTFGGDVTALRLNIDFSDVALMPGTAGLKLGDLRLRGLTTTPGLNGLTLRQYQDVVNTALGGGASTYGVADLDLLTFQINMAFGAGLATTFAQDHLQAPVPEPSTLLLLVSGVAVVAARRSRVRPT